MFITPIRLNHIIHSLNTQNTIKLITQKEFRREKHKHINGIEGFLSYAKKFLIKYNVISKKNFYLYLKEIEWRYNNRKEPNIKLKLIKLLKS